MASISHTSKPVSKIPKQAFQISTGVLVGLMLLAAAGRIAIRIKSRQRLYLSDGFLLFACLCLCGGTGILYWFFDDLYLLQAAKTDPFSIALPPNFVEVLSTGLKLLFAYQTLGWTCIYMIKFSFLAFFRPLLVHLYGLKIWWTCVTVVTVIAWVFTSMGAWIICPHFDLGALVCSSVSLNPRSRPIYGAVISLDVLTDISIISIPVILLWNARIQPRQKFWLLTSLCLSISMVVIGLVRASGITPGGGEIQDVPYALFLQQLEGCVSVLMASVSAFRSLFATESQRVQRSPPNFVMSVNRKLWNRRRNVNADGKASNGLPSIPSATITGLRTFINGGSGSTTLKSDFEEVPEEWPLSVKKPPTIYMRTVSTGQETGHSTLNTAVSPLLGSNGRESQTSNTAVGPSILNNGHEWQREMT